MTFRKKGCKETILKTQNDSKVISLIGCTGILFIPWRAVSERKSCGRQLADRGKEELTPG